MAGGFGKNLRPPVLLILNSLWHTDIIITIKRPTI